MILIIFILCISSIVEAELINTWHIPVNEEPPSVTMRNPLYIHIGINEVYFYLGAYPQGTISNATLYYRINSGSWNTSTLIFDSNYNNNEYYRTSINESFSIGDLVEYYFKVQANGYEDTYVYGTDTESHRTPEESQAQLNAFSFIVTDIPTPTPIPTPTMLNIWHIPINNEPPGYTMREPVYVHQNTTQITFILGSYPQGVINNATLYYKKSTETNWNSLSLSWMSNYNVNEYWSTTLNNTFQVGDIIEYYFKGEGSGYDTTYVYGEDSFSNITRDELTAQDHPFQFIIMTEATPTPIQSPTPTTTPNLMNVWHIPTNEEPPTVTMRNPLYPTENTDYVYFYLGGYPQGTIEQAFIYYRAEGQPSWTPKELHFDSNNWNNEYFMVQITNSFSAGTTIYYYFEARSSQYTTTYVYGDDTSTHTTANQHEAQQHAYSFEILPSGPSPTPTVELMNIWHIPTNYEPPNTTMRYPVLPDENTDMIILYLGGYPLGTIENAYLYYKSESQNDWQMITMEFDQNFYDNEYYKAYINGPFTAGETFYYYFKGTNSNFPDTFCYGDDTSTHTTDDEQYAQLNAFTFTIAPAGTPTPSPTPELLNVWHIPVNEEPPTVTMRNPLYPDDSVKTIYLYLGSYPIGQIANAIVNYRLNDGAWQTLELTWDSNNNNNEYYRADINVAGWQAGDIFQYYFTASSGSGIPTYVFGTDSHSYTTSDESYARENAFYFEVRSSEAPTPTPQPSWTPTPIHTPTPIPTSSPSPTPTIPPLGIDIELNQSFFNPGDNFHLWVTISNPNEEVDVDVYIFLDLNIGEYWFWPSWAHYPPDFDFRELTLPPQNISQIDILNFTWPSNAGHFNNAKFWAAMLYHNTTEIAGNYDSVTFSF